MMPLLFASRMFQSIESFGQPIGVESGSEAVEAEVKECADRRVERLLKSGRLNARKPGVHRQRGIEFVLAANLCIPSLPLPETAKLSMMLRIAVEQICGSYRGNSIACRFSLESRLRDFRLLDNSPE